MDTIFARSKKEKTHTRKENENEKYLGVTECIRGLILQSVEEPYLEALKEKYIGYDGLVPADMIHHLRSKISNVTNRDKAALKREIFLPWEQPTVLTAYFTKIKTTKKKLEKWNFKVTDNNIIIIHIVKQMYESNWFTEENMTKWEEKDKKNKTWDVQISFQEMLHHMQMVPQCQRHQNGRHLQD